MIGAAPIVPLRPVGYIMAAAACFTIIDTIVKDLAVRYSVPVLVWARWTMPAILMIALLAPKLRWALLPKGNVTLHVARGAVLTLSSLCSFTALKHLPLAEATGLSYSTPVLVTLLAAWLLREPMTLSRSAFVVAGFAGTLLVAQPGPAMPAIAVLLALAAAALNAMFQILTRKLAGEDLIAMIFCPSLVGALVMTIAVPFFPGETAYVVSDLAWFAAIGVLGAGGHFLFVQAFRQARACALAPFTYSQLIWSTLSGWLIFGTFPGGWAVAGLVVLGGSGVAMLAYERLRPHGLLRDTSRSNALGGPIEFCFPGLGVSPPEAIFPAKWLAMQAANVAVGGSFHVPDRAGGVRTVIRTD